MSTASTVKNELQKCIDRINIYTEGQSSTLTEAVNQLIGFTEIEYVESTGTQYINTGILSALDLKIECEYSTTTLTKALFGARTSSSADDFIFGYFHNNMMYFASYGGESSDVTGNILNYDGNKHKVIMSNDTFTIDGIDQPVGRGELNNSYNIYLFTWNNKGTADSRKFVGKIYSFKIYKANNLIQYLIPAKDENNVICFYDLVSKSFFYNIGTGAFLYTQEGGDE